MEQEHHKQKSYELIHMQFLEAAQHSHSCGTIPKLWERTQYRYCMSSWYYRNKSGSAMILFMSKEYQLILIFTVMNATKKGRTKAVHQVES